MGVSPVLVSFHLGDPFPLNHDYGRKGVPPSIFFGLFRCCLLSYLLHLCLDISGFRHLMIHCGTIEVQRPRPTNTSSFESWIAARLLWYPPFWRSPWFSSQKSRHFWGKDDFPNFLRWDRLASWRVNFTNQGRGKRDINWHPHRIGAIDSLIASLVSTIVLIFG